MHRSDVEPETEQEAVLQSSETGIAVNIRKRILRPGINIIYP